MNWLKFFKLSFLFAMLWSLSGCSSQDVPQAHKGRMFDKTGGFALWSGGHGFEGPILGPGTYYTGLYPEVRMVDCSQRTIKEALSALTKDGVQFNLDIYVRFSANCDDDKSVEKLLTTLAPSAVVAPPPDPKSPADSDTASAFPLLTITSRQLYNTYVRPALGEAVREAVATYIANEINSKRDEMFQKIKDKFTEYLSSKGDQKLLMIYSLNLSNLDFPDQLEKANVDRATQAVLKDKAIAEREKVTAEIETAKMRQQLVRADAENEAAKIDTIGAALHRNPEYYVRDVYYYGADKGGSVMLPTNPNVILQLTPKKP
jgi:regulator of protease activity HflC (stomatin/prohibitin superfamily)